MMERKYTLIRYYGANATSLTASGVLRVGAGTMWARAAWAALILVFVIGVSFLGLYEPAHTINRASGWFEYATEGTSSDFTSLFWPNIGIFDSGNEKHSRPTNEPSISRLFFFAIFGLLGAFVCALRAGYHLYEERCILGAVWLCLGASVAIIMISFAWLL